MLKLDFWNDRDNYANYFKFKPIIPLGVMPDKRYVEINNSMGSKAITIILMIVCGALLFLNIALSNKLKEVKTDYGSQVFKRRKDSVSISILNNLVLLHGSVISISWKKDFLLNDSSGNKITLQNLIGRRKYIYHFTEYNCFQCVEEFLPYIKKIANKVGKEDIAIVGSYHESKRLFLAMKRYETNGIPVYNLQPDFLAGEKIISLNTP